MFFETILPLLQFQTSLRLQSIAAPLGADHFLSDKTPAKNPDDDKAAFGCPGSTCEPGTPAAKLSG